MHPTHCAACGELLDVGSASCRFCGEDNSGSDVEEALEVDPTNLDRLKPWSQIKHEILEKYAHAYTTILSKQSWARRFLYIDAFAGAGIAVDAASDELVAAGALRALAVEPPFSEYHFIERDSQKADVLREIIAREPRNARVYEDDFRNVLPALLDRCRYEDRSRGLCLLDPYGLSIDYDLLRMIASTRTVELFFNFMLVSANRNVLWRMDPAHIPPARAAMMRRVWGNDDWRSATYEQQPTLFGDKPVKVSNERVISAYRKRLQDTGFAYVPEPMPMKNSANAAIYYLFFCSPKAVAGHIVEDIFSQYR